jgi:hypothetical protein
MRIPSPGAVQSYAQILDLVHHLKGSAASAKVMITSLRHCSHLPVATTTKLSLQLYQRLIASAIYHKKSSPVQIMTTTAEDLIGCHCHMVTSNRPRVLVNPCNRCLLSGSSFVSVKAFREVPRPMKFGFDTVVKTCCHYETVSSDLSSCSLAQPHSCSLMTSPWRFGYSLIPR